MTWEEYLPLAEKTLSTEFHCEEGYYQRINRIVDKSIYEDIANFYKLTPAQKFQAAMVLVPKGISDKHEVKGNVSLGITIISPTKGTIKL